MSPVAETRVPRVQFNRKRYIFTGYEGLRFNCLTNGVMSRS
jgi:hypothetical protein